MAFSNNILICRTDAIGDVVLTFAACGIIKEKKPGCTIFFLGRTYTKDIVETCDHIDFFLNFDELSLKTKKELKLFFKEKNINTLILLVSDKQTCSFIRKTGIKKKVGSIRFLRHLYTCNHFVFYKKKEKITHQSEINIQFLKGVGIENNIPKSMHYRLLGFTKIVPLDKEYENLLSNEKFNLIIHPKSNGHGKEWTLEKFSSLISILGNEKYKIFISGSSNEGLILDKWIKEQKNLVTNITGLFSLKQFISFISRADGLLASSTGPLHIAGAAGIHTLGLFPQENAKLGARWGAIGEKAELIQSADIEMDDISPEMVFERINKWRKH